MDVRPVRGDADIEICFDIYLSAINGVRPAGTPDVTPDDVVWLPVSLRHFGATDPDRSLFALDGDRPVAFGCAFQRDSFWFLSELMVLPDAQAAGVGRTLLEALLPPEGERPSVTLATTVEAHQPVSTMLYASVGIVPQVPLYWLDNLRDPAVFPALPDGVEAADLDLDVHGEGLDRLDRAVLGYGRRVDHAIWLRDADRARVYREAGGDIVGYGYMVDGWLCPVASLDELLTAAIMRDLVDGIEDTSEIIVGVMSNAPALLPLLLAAGMRADEDGAKLLYCSNGRVPPPSYLFYSGAHP